MFGSLRVTAIVVAVLSQAAGTVPVASPALSEVDYSKILCATRKAKGTGQVFIMMDTPAANYYFLTDSSRGLKAALQEDARGLRKFESDQAAQTAFQQQLSIWKIAAGRLPAEPGC